MSDINLSDGIKGDMGSSEEVPMETLTQNDSRPSESGELAHTGNSETLRGLHNQHTIVKGTFPWSTNDPVGTILFALPNHPSECNWLVEHIYSIFWAWIGFFMVDVRVLGTAFMGGSLAFVRVPPTYTLEQVMSMTREDISIFDYVEVDPKDVSTSGFPMKDFRSEHFHYSQFSDKDPRSFGGWLVCMVWGKLSVSPNTDGAALDVLVRTRGQYEFYQPRPLVGNNIAFESPFPLMTSRPITRLTGCDSFGQIGPTKLVVCHADNLPTNGFLFAYNPQTATLPGTNKFMFPMEPGWTTGFRNWNTTQRSKFENAYRQLQLQDSQPSEGFFMPQSSGLFAGNKTTMIVDDTHGLPPLNFLAQTNAQGYCAIKIGAEPVTDPQQWSNVPCFAANDDQVPGYTGPSDSYVMSFYRGQSTTAFLPGGLWIPEGADISPPTDMAKLTRYTPLPDSFNHFQPGEQVIYLETNHGVSAHIQPWEFKYDVKSYGRWPNQTSAIFEITDDSGTPMFYLRINSKGIMSTRSNLTGTTYLPGTKMRFLQWLSDRSQMPSNPPDLNATFMAKSQSAEIAKLKAQMRLLLTVSKPSTQ